MTPYDAGKPLAELAAELGLPELVRLSANENPLGPSPHVLDAIAREAARAHLYPDGGAVALRDALARRLGVRPDQLVVGNGADELIGLVAFAAFEPGDEVVVPQPSFEPYATSAGLAGLRVGYAAATAETCDRLNRVRAPYNVNRLGQAAALAALEDGEHWERTRRHVLEERRFLSEGLQKRGYTFPPSQANFLLVKVTDAAALRDKLLHAGLLVRDGADVGFPGHLRISVGLREANEKLLGAL